MPKGTNVHVLNVQALYRSNFVAHPVYMLFDNVLIYSFTENICICNC